jgi:hypothetical protein
MQFAAFARIPLLRCSQYAARIGRANRKLDSGSDPLHASAPCCVRCFSERPSADSGSSIAGDSTVSQPEYPHLFSARKPGL